MQRVASFFSETRQRSRSGQPPTAYELREENVGRLHRAAAHGDLARPRRWRWWLKRVGTDKRDKQKRTPLHLACANGDEDVVKHQVQKNCQMNLADSFERLPLMKAVECQQEKRVAILLEHGADPNLADADGNTALHLAVLSPNTTIVELLFEHNANIDAQNKDDYTPLLLAVSRHQEEMAEFLLKKGADRHAQDQHESELLVENVNGENMEEPHAGGAEDKVVLSSSFLVRTVDKAALAQDTGGAQPVGEVEQEHDAEFPEDFKACTRLQQELADALKKEAVSEALLEVTTHYNSVLDEDSLCLQRELGTVTAEIRESEERKLQSGHCVRDLEAVVDNKEREVVASCQKLLASSGTNATIKNVEEHVQRLEMKYSRLDAMVQQESSRTEALQRDLQASTSMPKQNVPSLTSEGLHSVSEEALQPKAHAKEHVDQSDGEKTELLEQQNSEAQQAFKLAEGICRHTECACKELVINFKLEKNHERMTTQLHGAMGNGRAYEEREMESEICSEDITKTDSSETGSEGGGLRRKVDDLSQNLEKESKKCMQLEEQNRDLQEQLSTMHESCGKLEKSKCQLEEEVAKLKHHLETNMVDRSQTEQDKREVEEQAAQGKRHEMQKVNLVLQVGELYNWLKKESKKRAQVEAQNRNLQKQLLTMRESREKLEKSECQLKEEVAKLKHHLETNMVDRRQIERYRREAEERARQFLRELEVSLPLRIQAVFQDRFEQATRSLSEMGYRLRDLQHQMENTQNSYQESYFQQQTLHFELQRYKKRYQEEVYSRKRLENELERTRKELSEAYAKIGQELRRNRLPSTSNADS